MRLLFDIEADGLYPTRFWCMSAIDIDKEQVYELGPDEIDQAIDLLISADTLVGHNIISYDLFWLNKLYNVDLYGKNLIDTLIWSRMFDPDREGGHGLAAWGTRLGYSKVEHEDWHYYSPEMQHRCTVDVKLNLKVYKSLLNKKKYFSDESIDLEQKVAKIIADQEDYGWYFDVQGAEMLLAKVCDELGDIEDEVRKTFKPKKFFIKEITPKIKKDGTLSKQGLRDYEYDLILATLKGGLYDLTPFIRYDILEFNLGSRQHIGKWLQEDYGWKPTEFTATGQAMINEKILETVEGIPEVTLIHKYLTLQKIQGFLTRWLDSVGEDDRQHGYVNTIGAVTRRMTHSEPNLAQVPSSRKLYGSECRSLFTVPNGYKLVGMDADGLELRMMAHYMDNPDYTEAVVNGDKDLGTDAHSVNMRAAGLTNRDQAKTMFYALIYGAGDGKLGAIIGGSVADGKKLKFDLFDKLPDLGDVIHKVQVAAERGFIKCYDGSVLNVRSARASFNTLLQGGGAVLMKRALVILVDDATREGLDFHVVGNIHDEIQAEVKAEHADRFAELAADSVRKAGEYYNLRCPMKGDASIGTNWSETH
jgi:DNA polymerase I-like protein with 3'-5' exonuclease and polymerase domains